MALVFRDQIKLWDATEMAIGFLLFEMMPCSLISFSGRAGDINSVQSEVDTLCPRDFSVC